jgi:hypothetical protein
VNATLPIVRLEDAEIIFCEIAFISRGVADRGGLCSSSLAE